jgi:hypothetical protein
VPVPEKIIPPTSRERGPKALKYIKGEEKQRGEEGKEGNIYKDKYFSTVIYYSYYNLTISYEVSSVTVSAQHLQSHFVDIPSCSIL